MDDSCGWCRDPYCAGDHSGDAARGRGRFGDGGRLVPYTLSGPESCPGRRKDCPPWCEVDHGQALDGGHRGFVAELHRGEHSVIITVVSGPHGTGPAVSIDGWDLAADVSGGILASPDEASGLAVIMAALGRADVAGYLRAAAGMLSEPEPETTEGDER